MTPVMRRGENGCLRACIASVLDMTWEEVPEFVDHYDREDLWLDRMMRWCYNFGIEAYVVMDWANANGTCFFMGSDLIICDATHAVVGDICATQKFLPPGEWTTDFRIKYNPTPEVRLGDVTMVIKLVKRKRE